MLALTAVLALAASFQAHADEMIGRVSYARAEDLARTTRAGMKRGDSGAMAPWEWRHRSR